MDNIRNVIITVKEAELTEKFVLFGKMDPYAKVDWIDGATQKREPLARTHTDWNAHFNPVWEFTCRGKQYNTEETHGDRVAITVYEDDGKFLKPKTMGSVEVNIKTLLGISEKGRSLRRMSLVKGKDLVGPICDLTLKHKNGSGKSIGTIYVQARAVCLKQVTSSRDPDEYFTRVDADMFAVPVKRFGVSGGTAPFFELILSVKKTTQSGRQLVPNRFIGKDLSRATDELDFYEELLVLKKQQSKLDDMRFGLLLDFTFEYKGVFTAKEEGQPDQPAMDLLVLQNLGAGMEKLRLLDLKIGRQTAQAGWQGKSPMRAWKQYLVDGSTNSVTEGFRLEGFDNMPLALQSREPLLGMPGGQTSSDKTKKKARRVMLQSLPSDQIFMYFLDLRKEPNRQADLYTNVELAELFLHEIVERLVRLSLACHRVQIPQKWIGSSVALGFDAGYTPSRSENVNAIRGRVRVNVFDWGRSELNTIEKHQEHDRKDDRSKFWGYYKEGIDIMSWNAARTYFRQFCCKSWTTIEINVLDFDMHQLDESMGKVTLPLANMPLHSYALTGKGAKGEVAVAIEWWEAPVGSRLKGSWRVFISHGKGLPNKDTFSLSDPYCILTAQSPTRCFQQVTSVKQNTLDPVWHETFDLPLATDPDDNLIDALECGANGLTNNVDVRNMLGFEAGTYDLNDVRVSYGKGHQTTRDDVKEWTKHLERVAEVKASSRPMQL